MLRLLIDDKLFLAPIEKPQVSLTSSKMHKPGANDLKKVLDIGCGTGIWSMYYAPFSQSVPMCPNPPFCLYRDFADEFPDCEVIGTDLSPIQPQFCPPNCQFEIDDCTEPWTFPKISFDMIHVRCLFGSVGDWPAFYREALE